MLGRLFAASALLVAGLSSCLPAPEQAVPLSATFAVSDYFTPSGYMGDGARLGNLSVEVNSPNCKPRPAGHQGDCYVFTYHKDAMQTDHWAGVYWVFPANNWGTEYGHAIVSENFKQVRYYAAVEAPMPYTANGAAQPFNTFSGGIDPNGFYNNLGMQEGNGLQDHKDAVSNMASLGSAVGTGITATLQPFHYDLTDFEKGANCIIEPPAPMPQIPNNCDAMGFASDLIGAFGWAAHYPDDGDPNGTMDVKVYLDDIVWDTNAP